MELEDKIKDIIAGHGVRNLTANEATEKLLALFEEQKLVKKLNIVDVSKSFIRGDRITLNTGYLCDIGVFEKYDKDCVVWIDKDGSRYTSPMSKYNITFA